jgi:hypothetical protein
MLTETDFSQIQDYCLQKLPLWLRQSPEIATAIESIVAKQFPRRDDFARLLEEMKALRQEVSWRLELQSQEIHDHRQDMEQRFEQVDKRFEQVDKRFERVEQQLGDLRTDNLQIKRKIVKLQAGQEHILKRLDGQEAWLRVTIGSLHRNQGETFEDMFAAGLRYGLQDEEITAETIRLREPLLDHDGLVFEKGYRTEVDLVARNGRLIVFEVKTTVKPGEVDFFAWKVELVRAQNPTLQVRGVFISLGALAAVKQRCQEKGLELLS